MKKVLLIICALLVVNLFPVFARAQQTVSDSEAQIVQTFTQESDLYAYVNIPEGKKDNTLTADALLDNTYSFAQAEPIVTVEKSASPVSYMFLVDVSTSMPNFQANVESFIGDFMSLAGENASFALATFGKEFKIDCDFTKKQEAVKASLKALQYNIRQTSLYTSLYNAVDYYNKRERTEGELYNIIVISDGVEVDKNGITREEVEKKIKESAVLIHTFGLPTKSTKDEEIKTSQEALKVMGSYARASLGVHTVLGYDGKSEKELAQEIISFVRQLYITRFDVTDFKSEKESFTIKLVFAASGNDAMIFNAWGTVTPVTSGAIPSPSITKVIPPDNGSIQQEIAETLADQESTGKQGISIAGIKGMLLGMICLIIVIVVVVLVLLLLLFRKRYQRSPSASDGIYMKAEILSGNCKLEKNELYLSEELYIGRDKTCAIRLRNRDVSKKNSRIYVRDFVVYLEDLNSTNGTMINNMKIFSPNKLRSGDVITIGSVSFTLKF